MTDLKNTTELVKAILEENEQTRNSDSFLYLKVLSAVGQQKGIDIEKMTVPFFLENLHGAGLPGFETVRRTRQKIQQHHPELASSDRIAAFRADNEAEFREYARGTV